MKRLRKLKKGEIICWDDLQYVKTTVTKGSDLEDAILRASVNSDDEVYIGKRVRMGLGRYGLANYGNDFYRLRKSTTTTK